jgi:hypothetical protein
MRPGRTTVLTILSLAAVCVLAAAAPAKAQCVEPPITGGGFMKVAVDEGMGSSVSNTTWMSFVGFDHESWLGLLTARWLVASPAQPAFSQKAVVPTRRTVVLRRKF